MVSPSQPPIPRLRLVFGGLLLAYCALIFILSHQTVSLPGPDFVLKDKLIHFIAYGIMALLAALTFSSPTRSSLRTLVYALVFTGLYGGSDEWHQYYVPGRHASLEDWIADLGGAVFALLVIYPRLPERLRHIT